MSVRIAQRMVSRNYMSSLNTSLARRAESLERGASGLKFKKLSDNVADGTRAMLIQEQRYQATQQRENTENILAEMNSVDGHLDSIDEMLQTMSAKVLEGMDEGYGQNKRDVLAQEIGKQKEQLLQYVNAQFAGKYLFGGTNNSGPAFTVDETSGKLLFNGVQADQIYKNSDKESENYGKYCYKDGDDEKVVPQSGSRYMDVGLGMRLGDNQTIDTRTTMDIAISGLSILGFGEPVTGEKGTQVANNLYDLMTQIEDTLKNYGTAPEGALDDMHGQLVALNDSMRMARTDLGTRMNFLERTSERLEADIDNMGEMESMLVSADPAEEAINLKNCEYVWKAVLQMGNMILPTSLLDYMR